MSAGLPTSFPPTGGINEPDFVRLPEPGTLFTRRAQRLRALSDGHPLGPFLTFLAHIADTQSAVAARLVPAVAGERTRQRATHGMPALAKEDLGPDGFATTLDILLQHGRAPGAPDQAEQARGALQAMAAPDRMALAGSVFEGSYPVDRLGEALYVAAALQVHLAVQASALEPGTLKPVANGVCPACGGAPVASLVVGWAKADHSRYCCCSLCATLWNYIRIKCTSCGSTEQIGYLQLEGQPEGIAAETCGVCQTYIKHLHQHRLPALEPFADDIASFALDLLVRDEGFRPAGLNPFMIGGAA